MTFASHLRTKLGRWEFVYWIAFALVTFYLGLAFISAQVTNNSRSGCSRANVSRQADYDNWHDAARTREATGRAMPPGAERKISLDGAATYRRNAEKPVAANEKAGVALAPGSPQVNCGAAYPDVLWLP
jgi:hypothetical protein